MKKIIIVFLLILHIGFHVQAADKLFITLDAIPIPDNGIGSPGAEKTPVDLDLDLDLATQLTEGQQFDIPLLDGQIVQGTVKQETTNQEGNTVEIISLDNGKGSLELTIDGSTISEMLLFDKDKTNFYHADLNANGVGDFIEEDPDSHVCVEYPLPSASIQAIKKHPVGIEGLTPDINTLKTLQSNPSAPNVIYIDYWGGTLSGTVWNDSYNSGEDIVYSPYDNDNNTNIFSINERYLMWLGWREVVEDFAPFNVNVTTDPAVYNATPLTNRIRNISTNTDFFLRGFGGYAYYNAFGQNNDYTAVSWTWNNTAGSHGMTISHELGHQLNLGHDGTSEGTYYGGHNNWGSIMGAPFGKSYVQWNKGEYPDSNNFENDIDIIKAQLGTVINDANSTIATATTIDVNQTDLIGLITPFGITGADVDYYKFTFSIKNTLKNMISIQIIMTKILKLSDF